jgi:hypothetical protein
MERPRHKNIYNICGRQDTAYYVEEFIIFFVMNTYSVRKIIF